MLIYDWNIKRVESLDVWRSAILLSSVTSGSFLRILLCHGALRIAGPVAVLTEISERN